MTMRLIRVICVALLGVALGCQEPKPASPPAKPSPSPSTKPASGDRGAEIHAFLQGAWDVTRKGKTIYTLQVQGDAITFRDLRFSKPIQREGALRVLPPHRFGISVPKDGTSYYRLVRSGGVTLIGLGDVWPLPSPTAFEVPLSTVDAVVYDGKGCKSRRTGEAITCELKGEGAERTFEFQGPDPFRAGATRTFVFHFFGRFLVSSALFVSRATRR